MQIHSSSACQHVNKLQVKVLGKKVWSILYNTMNFTFRFRSISSYHCYFLLDLQKFNGYEYINMHSIAFIHYFGRWLPSRIIQAAMSAVHNGQKMFLKTWNLDSNNNNSLKMF